jgi:hypothetical protein
MDDLIKALKKAFSKNIVYQLKFVNPVEGCTVKYLIYIVE